MKHPFSCPDGLVFDEKTSSCDFPENVPECRHYDLFPVPGQMNNAMDNMENPPVPQETGFMSMFKVGETMDETVDDERTTGQRMEEDITSRKKIKKRKQEENRQMSDTQTKVDMPNENRVSNRYINQYRNFGFENNMDRFTWNERMNSKSRQEEPVQKRNTIPNAQDGGNEDSASMSSDRQRKHSNEKMKTESSNKASPGFSELYRHDTKGQDMGFVQETVEELSKEVDEARKKEALLKSDDGSTQRIENTKTKHYATPNNINVAEEGQYTKTDTFSYTSSKSTKLI